MTNASNPLLKNSDLPNKAPAFDQIKIKDYVPAVKEAIKEARKNIEIIKNSEEPPTFDNTIVAMETASEKLGTVTSVFYNLLSAVGGDKLHKLVEQIGPISADFSSDIILDETLFERVKTVYERTEKNKMCAEDTMLLEDTYKSFVRGGALLEEAGKTRMREISQQTSILGPSFMQNVNKSAERFEMIIDNENDLAGLPDSAIDSASHAATEKGHEGKWLFTLDFPSFYPFIKYADNRALREKLWRAYGSRAWKDEFDNQELILTIVRLRDERAKLLGYDTHAEYILEERMAETPQTVRDFSDKLKAAYKPSAQKELEDLKSFARVEFGHEDLQPWDIAYYSEKWKERLFNFSSEELRPYFQLDKVLDGAFKHFSKLFGIRFESASAYPVWHKDVKTFDVYDQKDNSFVGTFYADFHPREGKKNGAWMTTFRNQGLFEGKVERPIIAIVCNFTKPTATKPSLLTHGEVTTLFHEMGHAMHGMLANTKYRSLSGVNVKWDFVELPSMVQENWCYEKETLDIFAEHYETGEKIPSELIDKLRASKNFMNGWAGLRQVGLGALDMAWHTADPKEIKDVAAFEDEITKDTSLFPRLAGPTSISFSHIFAGGYSAGYYSYKWSEVLDADTFEAFLENGLYDAKTAKSYKEEILEKGGTQEPAILYENFRGRAPDTNALLRREGLLERTEEAA